MKPAHALAAVRSLCGLGLTAELLVPALLETLHAVVPSYRNLFDWTDERGRLLRYFIEGPIDAELARHYFDEFHNGREEEAMPRFDSLVHRPAGVYGPRQLDAGDFYRSALYHEIWRPQGLHSRIEAVVRGRSGRLLGSLVLYRAPGEAPFVPIDEQRLSALLPAIAHGLEAAGLAGAPEEQQLASPDPSETVLLTLQGEVRHASAGAHRLLLMADGWASRESLSQPLAHLGGGWLPPLLARLRERARERGSALHAAPLSARQITPGGVFAFSASLLAPLLPGDEPLAQVVIRRLEPHRVAIERVLRGLPLTPGQRAVCRELYRGRTHASIARDLGVALATVTDHVRKLRVALDVRSAPELRSLIDSRLGALA